MTVNVASTNTTNSFQYWLNRTNELANAMTTQAVTTNSAFAVGNGGITGTFFANTFSSGNSTSNVSIGITSVTLSNSTSNLTISIPTTAQISNGNYFTSANGSWVQIPLLTTTQTFSGNNVKLVDQWPLNQHTSGEYSLAIIDNASNNYQSTKILVVHNFGNAISTEYGTLITNATAGVIGSFNANTDSANLYLYFTPNSTNTTVKFIRTLL